MANNNFSDGVWRTIGGRRIFIRTGQSVSSAMKESGKFKNTKKKESNEKDRRLQDGKEIHDVFRQMNDKEMKAFVEKNPDSIKKMQEYLSNKNDEYYNKLTADQKKIVDRAKQAGVKEYERDREIGTVKAQQAEIENASGLKVNKAFETDLYGNGKEDRFELEDGRWVAHTKESLGQKDDTWTVNKLENGKVQSQKYDSYDDMINNLDKSNQSNLSSKDPAVNLKNTNNFISDLSASERKSMELSNEFGLKTREWKSALNNSKYSIDDINKTLGSIEYNDEAYGKDRLLHRGWGQSPLPNKFLSSEENTRIKQLNTAIYKAPHNSKEYREATSYLRMMNNKAASKYLDQIKSKGAYKKAFAEYKKAHPNSKISLNKFIDMSEGK